MTRRRGPRPRARVAARGRDDTDKGAPSTSPHACADSRRSRSHAHVAARTHKDADDPDFRSAAMRTPLPQGLPVPPRLLPQRRRHPPPPAVDGAAVSSSHAAGATYLVGRPTPFSRRRHRAHQLGHSREPRQYIYYLPRQHLYITCYRYQVFYV